VVQALKSGFVVRFPLVRFLRECLVLPLWLHLASGNPITWRGKGLKLQSGGLLETPSPTRIWER